MNKGNERLMAIIVALRKLPRWALISITVGVIVILGVAMFLLLPQSSPSTGDASYLTSTSYAFSVFLKLGVVVLIIAGLAILFRRMQTKNQGFTAKRIEVVETVHLSPHRTLYLVNVEDQKILIGATDQSMTTLFQLGKIENQNDQTQQLDSSQNFADLLDNAKNSREN
jgi:flagellar biosynthetic protein FliO